MNVNRAIQLIAFLLCVVWLIVAAIVLTGPEPPSAPKTITCPLVQEEVKLT